MSSKLKDQLTYVKIAVNLVLAVVGNKVDKTDD